MIEYPKKLDIIFDKLLNNGIKPIIVGGFIRDSILKITTNDIDIEVYNISSLKNLELLLKEFGSTNSVGKSFGVVKLNYKNSNLDFTLPRIDSKIASGHKGFNIEINPSLDFYSAFSRRDFTINAIGFDVKEKVVIDPFNGVKDLKNKILRVVDEKTFVDDPLRVLRAVRFCAIYDLRMDKNLFKLAQKMVAKKMLNELSKERVFLEINKLLLNSKKPSIGLALLKDIGALKYFTQLQNSNLYSSILKTVDEMKKLLTNNDKTNTILMLSSVCYGFNENELISFMKNITNEKKIIDKILLLVNNYKKIDAIYSNGVKNSELFYLAAKVNIEEVLLLSKAVYLAKNSTKTYKAGEVIKQRAEELNILNKKLSPFLKGRDILELESSLHIKIERKNFSVILNNAYKAQINGIFSSHKQAIQWLKNYLRATLITI